MAAYIYVWYEYSMSVYVLVGATSMPYMSANPTIVTEYDGNPRRQAGRTGTGGSRGVGGAVRPPVCISGQPHLDIDEIIESITCGKTTCVYCIWRVCRLFPAGCST